MTSDTFAHYFRTQSLYFPRRTYNLSFKLWLQESLHLINSDTTAHYFRVNSLYFSRRLTWIPHHNCKHCIFTPGTIAHYFRDIRITYYRGTSKYVFRNHWILVLFLHDSKNHSNLWILIPRHIISWSFTVLFILKKNCIFTLWL